ncbi:hypothetical protein ACE34P_002871 [Vibrio fluvialis]|uniref:hypothetical protein n=1 Tax=Vibrio fluvialis TaxID=676 RepID=UPI001302863A|nr:hypothetical protein [Vibrio fluvialis]ELS8947833.1 hypothetical protein [Vibrio fluvialis]MBY7826972.1 hypothetical protein [Vibrio fluvialis]MBY8159575.1 hypothetical protein [Vibrio fluvialis]MCG6386763.1 hypothetical protein [Vibrio fluvialis]
MNQTTNRLSFTQKVLLHKRMVELLRQSKSEHSLSAADKLEATLNGMQGITYSGMEAGRKEAAYEQARFQLEKEGAI